MAQVFQALQQNDDYAEGSGSFRVVVEEKTLKKLHNSLKLIGNEGDIFTVVEVRETVTFRPPKRMSDLVLQATPVRRRDKKATPPSDKGGSGPSEK